MCQLYNHQLSTKMNEQPVINLDGYLHSLRRLSGNRCDYWAEVIEVDGNFGDCFKTYLVTLDVKYIGSSAAGYREIDALFETELQSSLRFQDEDLIKLFVWDIIEYIQMTYRGTDPEIDPIRENKALIITANSACHGNFRYLVVPVEHKMIIIGLATRV
jgi:hypothetical protein